MKTNFKRVLISVLAATTIFTASGPVLANKITVNMPTIIYETMSKNNISSGVVHEKIMKFTVSGWWNINVLRIDLSDPHTEIKGLVNSDGISNRDKVTSLVEKSKAVAGINGSFFNYNPLPSALGPVINNGELITATNQDSNGSLPGIFIDFLNEAKIDYFNRKITATNLSKGSEININAVNNVSENFNGITMLNKHWGSKSIGTRFHSDLIEVVVENDYVADIRVGKEAITIPANGYVLIGRGQQAQQLLNQAIGDYMDLNVSNTPGINDIRFAIGGGSYILENGQLRTPSIPSPGNAPRTGVGISQNGKEIILVTIDGRTNSFVGVSQEMLGTIMKDLGAHNALNLDGGGSTTMAIKPIDEEKSILVNRPSEGGERLVVNGIGVFSNAPIGELDYIKVSTDDTNMFVNTTREFTVKGYDKYHNPVTIDESLLEFSHEDKLGVIDGNKFKSASKGTAKIKVQYNDISASIDLNVLGTIKDITTSLSNLNMDINSERSLPTFYGKDKNGFEAKIYAEDITFSTINDIGQIENGKFYSGPSPIAGVLVAKIDEGLKNIIVRVGSEGKLIEGFESLDKLKFASYPTTVLGEIALSEDAKEGEKSIALKYDFSIGENTRAAYLRFGDEENSGLAIEGLPRKLGLWVHGNSKDGWLRGSVKDNKGNSHKVDFAKTVDWTGWQFVIGNIPESVSYPIVLEEIYLTETDSLNKQSGEILLDGLTAFYPPILDNTVLPNQSALKDEKNIKASVKEEGFSFAVVMDPKGLNDLVKYDASSKIRERINKHKIAVLLNGLSDEFAKGLKNYARINAFGNYGKNKHKDVFFLHVNTEKGGIRATNSEQWSKLIPDLQNRAENNIVLFLSSPVFGANGFKDSLEADLLHKHLMEAREDGKNIFVVHGGNSNTSLLKDGIRYIELNTSPIKAAEDIYKLGIVEFVVNGSEVTYEINNLFQKPSVKVTP